MMNMDFDTDLCRHEVSLSWQQQYCAVLSTRQIYAASKTLVLTEMMACRPCVRQIWGDALRSLVNGLKPGINNHNSHKTIYIGLIYVAIASLITPFQWNGNALLYVIINNIIRPGWSVV